MLKNLVPETCAEYRAAFYIRSKFLVGLPEKKLAQVSRTSFWYQILFHVLGPTPMTLRLFSFCSVSSNIVFSLLYDLCRSTLLSVSVKVCGLSIMIMRNQFL